MSQVLQKIVCNHESSIDVLTVLEEINFGDILFLQSIFNKVLSSNTKVEEINKQVTTIELMILIFCLLRLHWVVTLAKYLMCYVYDFQFYSLLL